MDMSILLPLLLSNKGGGKNSEALALLMRMTAQGKKPDESELVGEMLKNGGYSPETAAMINAAMKNRGGKPRKSVGLRSILGVVNDEILGKITKYMDDVM